MRLLFGLLLASLVGLACGRSENPRSESSGRDPIFLAAIDGLEWDVLLPLLRESKLPTFAGLLQRGSFGLLRSSQPTFSPVLWTTVATGKTSDEHGIRGFVVREGRAVKRLYNARDRKAKALWNILTDAGRSVAVVGWWMTYPVETVNGVMVAQVNTLDQAFGARGRAVAKGRLIAGLDAQVYPPDLTERVLAIHERVGQEFGNELKRIFGKFRGSPSRLERQLLANTVWSVRADVTYLNVLLELLRDERAPQDLIAFYLGGTDVIGHRYWRYRSPEEYVHPPSAPSVESFGHMISDYYVYVDQALGRLLARLPATTTVIIVSDHGMHAASTEQDFDAEELPLDVNSGGHADAPPGVFIAAGAGIRSRGKRNPAQLERSDLSVVGSLYDIAPTILALLDLPVGEDMGGHVLLEMLENVDSSRIRMIPTHDTPAWKEARAALSPEQAHQLTEEARIEQLRALGYIQ